MVQVPNTDPGYLQLLGAIAHQGLNFIVFIAIYETIGMGQGHEGLVQGDEFFCNCHGGPGLRCVHR